MTLAWWSQVYYFPNLSSYFLHLIRFFCIPSLDISNKKPQYYSQLQSFIVFTDCFDAVFYIKASIAIVSPIGEVSLFNFNTALKNPLLCPTQRHGSGTTDGALPSAGLTGSVITQAIKRQFLGHLLLLLSISWCIISHLIQTSLLTFQTRSFFLSNLTPLFAPSEKY